MFGFLVLWKYGEVKIGLFEDLTTESYIHNDIYYW
jgi:hypothetical protein